MSIKHFLKELLSSKSDLSMIRFLHLICVLIAFIISLIGLYTSQNVDMLVALFLGSSFSAKVAQKFAETKS